MTRLANLVLVYPAIQFALFTAWAREKTATGAFSRAAITRTEYERSLQVAANLRARAAQLRQAASRS
jgi:hypothetical protein